MQARNQVAIPTITMMERILAGKAPVAGLLTSVADLYRAGIEVLPST
jgi:hypothetical protein